MIVAFNPNKISFGKSLIRVGQWIKPENGIGKANYPDELTNRIASAERGVFDDEAEEEDVA